MVAVLSGALLSACGSERDSTITATYSAGIGGIVYYTDERGYEVKSTTGDIKVALELQAKHGEDLAVVTAEPERGYTFEKWSDGVTTAARQDIGVTADISVQAIFVRSEYFVRYSAASAAGYIEGEKSQAVSPNAAAEQVTAVANNGYSFVKWSDGVTTATRQDMDITSNTSISAIFKRNEYTLEYTAGVHGSIDGETEQTVEFEYDGDTVTAVPDKGYVFAGWSDGVQTAERAETEVCESMHVIANFEPITREYDLSFKKTLFSDVYKQKITVTHFYGHYGCILSMRQI
ncbi:MAG: InlB B-repeat-containing protein [Roseburia sp.]|nr:InlB B-repeat-containing protein [Roseburia sp.]